MAKSSALPLLAGGAAVLLLASSGKKKKKTSGSGSGSGKVRWGVRIPKGCQEVIIDNAEIFQDFLFGAYNELIEIDPDLGVLQITDALFGEVAPHCSGFPEEPESAAIVEFYTFIARHISMFMIDDARLSVTAEDLANEATKVAFGDWYQQWAQYPTPEVGDIPSDQAGISGDYKKLKIGPDWYANNVRPFVEQAIKQGRADTAFEDYVANRGILVGNIIKPISELPQDKTVVDQFLDALEEAIDKATEELGG